MKKLSVAALLALTGAACHHDDQSTTTPAPAAMASRSTVPSPEAGRNSDEPTARSDEETSIGTIGEPAPTGEPDAGGDVAIGGKLGDLGTGKNGIGSGVGATREDTLPHPSPTTLASGGVATEDDTSVDAAIAVMRATKFSKVTGTISFRQTSDGIAVRASLKGLAKGAHPFDVHQFGDCSAADAVSTGDVFTIGASAAAKNGLGEITGKGAGTTTFTTSIPNASQMDVSTIIGRSIVIDDLTSTGAKHLACGVIGVAQSTTGGGGF